MPFAPVRRWRAVLPVVCFALIGLCWVVSTPPSAGVDEGSHFARLIGMSQGGLIGGKVPDDRPVGGGLDADQVARVNREAGTFEIPSPLVVPVVCNNTDPTMPYRCPLPASAPDTHLDVSFHAHSLPLAYVLPAAASLLASTTWRAFLFSRAAFLAQDVALLAIAMAALRRARLPVSSVALGTLALCVTPLIAFQSGTLAPNGTEIWATIAFLCSLAAALRMSSSRWVWIAAGVGAAACWSRDLGALYVVVFAAATFAALPNGARWLWSRRRTTDAFAAVVLAMAGLTATIWQLVLKVGLHPRLEPPSRLWADLGLTVHLLADSVGLLGWLNVPIDPLVNAVWQLAWVAGVAVLIARASVRTRVVVAGLWVFYVIVNLALISSIRAAGFGTQPRYTIAIPIASVVVLALDQSRPGPRARAAMVAAPAAATPLQRLRWPLVGACAIVAAGNFSGLILSAEHNASGITGFAMDFLHVAWAPSGGWRPTRLLFVVACGSVLVLPLAALRPRRPAAAHVEAFEHDAAPAR